MKYAKKPYKGKNRGKLHHIIVLAEGVGNAYDVSKAIEEKTGIDTRVTVLGYIQGEEILHLMIEL